MISSSDNAGKPSILWLGRRVPLPLDAGDRVYSYRLMQAAGRTSAQVTSCSLLPPGIDATGLPPEVQWHPVRAGELGTLQGLVSTLPLVSARSKPRVMVSALRDLLRSRRFDAIVFDYYASGWALDEVRRAGHEGRIVYVAHNHEAGLARAIARDFKGNPLRGMLLGANAAKIARLERKLVDAADLVVCLTESDREVFRAESRRNVSYLVLPPGYSGQRVAHRRINSRVPRRAVMLGSVRWMAKQMNVASFLTAADEKFRRAGVTVDIIGDVDEGFRAGFEPRLKATRFRGFVDDIGKELGEARIGLMIEATGGGFKLKIQDYIYHRVPVAALEGSFEGLPTKVADAFMVEPDMESLTHRILAEIDDVEGLDVRQDRAFEGARGLFDWAENGRRLIEAITCEGRAAQAR